MRACRAKPLPNRRAGVPPWRMDMMWRDRGAVSRVTRRGTLAALAGAAAGPAWAQAAPSWRIVTEYPATAMPGEGIAAFAAAATRLAAGALTVQPAFDAPDGLRSAGMLAALAAGRIEAADAFTGAMGGGDPLFLLSSLPFLTASGEDARRLYDAARPHYEAALARQGAVLLYATPWPPSGLWTRRPVTTPAELAGLRLRCFDRTGVSVFGAAGAAAEELSFADTMPRLQAGALDGVLSSGDGGAGRRLWQWLPHFTALDYAWPLSLAFCSAAALGRLPEGAKAAVAAAGREAEARQWEAIRTRLGRNEAVMRANGVAIHRPDAALRQALRQAAGTTIAGWEAQAGEAGRAAIAAYRRS